jgi:chain length determinant protein EpsF
MNFRQILRILRVRARLIATLVLACTALGAALAFLLPVKYTASTALLIDAKSANAVLGTMLPAQMLSGYMATQVDIITSRRVTERAAASPDLTGDSQLQARWREETGGATGFPEWLGTELQRELKVTPSRDSNMVVLSYDCAVAERCARIVNAVAKAYIDTNLQLKVTPARQYAGWFDERTRKLRDTLEAAQTKLSEYQQAHGIVTTDERLDVENARLEELSRQWVTAQAERSASRSRQAQSGAAATLPEVVSNPLIAGLKGELARLESQRSQTVANLGPNHPARIEADRDIASLRSRIGVEMGNIAGSIATADRVNAAREAELSEAVSAQKAKVLKIKAERDRMAMLQQDVGNAQKAYDLVTGRLAETSLEGQAQQTNVSVLVPATAPLLPSSPRRALLTGLAAVFGMLLGISLALIHEMARRRVRSTTDVVDLLGIPVLGVLPHVVLASAPALPAPRRIEPRL